MVKKDKVLKNLFYVKFLGALTKKGKKMKAKKILDAALLKVSIKTKLPSNFLLYRVFHTLSTFVEIRRIHSRRSSYFVPFNVSFSRRIFLALKWILLAVKADKRKVSFTNKFSVELLKIITNSHLSESLKFKSLNNSQAFANKANTHFRW